MNPPKEIESEDVESQFEEEKEDKHTEKMLKEHGEQVSPNSLYLNLPYSANALTFSNISTTTRPISPVFPSLDPKPKNTGAFVGKFGENRSIHTHRRALATQTKLDLIEEDKEEDVHFEADDVDDPDRQEALVHDFEAEDVEAVERQAVDDFAEAHDQPVDAFEVDQDGAVCAEVDHQFEEEQI